MKPKLSILSGPEWQRVLAYVRDLNIPNAESQSDSVLGIRLSNVLVSAGWTVFTSDDYSRACTAIREHYATKEQQAAMGEPEGFAIGQALLQYSVDVLIKAARLAHEHRSNKNFLRGLSAGLGGYSAAQMAKAAEYWPEWLLDDPPAAQTVDECRTLFALAGLPRDQAMAGYIRWREDSSLTFYEMYQYVLEIKAQTRLKDFGKYTAHKRAVKRGTDGMKKTAGAAKQPAIEKIEAILEKEL